MSSNSRFYLGLDLGQSSDYTALTVQDQKWNAEKGRFEYELRYLDRVRGMSYPNVVQKVSKILASEKLMRLEPPTLVIDKTGVGSPVCDMFQVGSIWPIEITITSGQSPSVVQGGYHVPKRDIVFSLLAVFQSGRLKIAEGLPLAKSLMDELVNFRVKINIAGHDSYSAWRENEHDDLVLSAAMATWYGEYCMRNCGPETWTPPIYEPICDTGAYSGPY